jgi:hypothetical protein
MVELVLLRCNPSAPRLVGHGQIHSGPARQGGTCPIELRPGKRARHQKGRHQAPEGHRCRSGGIQQWSLRTRLFDGSARSHSLPQLRISAIPGSAFSLIPGSVSQRCRAEFQRDAGHTLSSHVTGPMVARLPGIA